VSKEWKWRMESTSGESHAKAMGAKHIELGRSKEAIMVQEPMRRCKEVVEQNILVLLILLPIHYSPLEENNGHREDFIEQVYSPNEGQMEVNPTLPQLHSS